MKSFVVGYQLNFMALFNFIVSFFGKFYVIFWWINAKQLKKRRKKEPQDYRRAKEFIFSDAMCLVEPLMRLIKNFHKYLTKQSFNKISDLFFKFVCLVFRWHKMCYNA